jgi:hypothetical protein
MITCSLCAAQFFPQSSSWGQLCGNCIASRIELSLMPGGLQEAQRKPLKRASEEFSNDESWAERQHQVSRERASGNG